MTSELYTAEEVVLTKQMCEALRQIIENDKRINELEIKIQGLLDKQNKNI